jgi:hypothetical protein
MFQKSGCDKKKYSWKPLESMETRIKSRVKHDLRKQVLHFNTQSFLFCQRECNTFWAEWQEYRGVERGRQTYTCNQREIDDRRSRNRSCLNLESRLLYNSRRRQEPTGQGINERNEKSKISFLLPSIRDILREATETRIQWNTYSSSSFLTT